MDLATRGVIEVFPPYLVSSMGWNTGINFRPVLGRARGHALDSRGHRRGDHGLAVVVGAQTG